MTNTYKGPFFMLHTYRSDYLTKRKIDENGFHGGRGLYRGAMLRCI